MSTGRVSVGFLAAIVAAANAGGAGSVIGDTTTTIMWLNGVSPLAVLPAYVAAIAAFAVFGAGGAMQQQAFQPILAHDGAAIRSIGGGSGSSWSCWRRGCRQCLGQCAERG